MISINFCLEIKREVSNHSITNLTQFTIWAAAVIYSYETLFVIFSLGIATSCFVWWFKKPLENIKKVFYANAAKKAEHFSLKY